MAKRRTKKRSVTVSEYHDLVKDALEAMGKSYDEWLAEKEEELVLDVLSGKAKVEIVFASLEEN